MQHLNRNLNNFIDSTGRTRRKLFVVDTTASSKNITVYKKKLIKENPKLKWKLMLDIPHQLSKLNIKLKRFLTKE